VTVVTQAALQGPFAAQSLCKVRRDDPPASRPVSAGSDS
jgi:hypothetical protein